MAHSIDGIIIGGGVQGLVLCGLLVEKGFNAIVISESHEEQSLVNHGYMHTGCIFPSPNDLLKDWPSDIIETLKKDQNKILFSGPSSFMETFKKQWNGNNTTFNSTSIPTCFENGGMSQFEFAEIEDFVFCKNSLINVLGEKVANRVYYGNISSLSNNENIVNITLQQKDGNSIEFEYVYIFIMLMLYFVLKLIIFFI